MADTEALSPRTDALHVIVELLGSLGGDAKSGGREFYDRVCEACCRLGAMTRAGILLYDDARQLVVPVGSHGVEPGLFSEVYGTLEETPIAQVALSEDRVVEVTGDIGRWVPERYARLGGVETLCTVPVSAGDRWLGVIFADRGGTRFELTGEERHDMWTLGKTAALAASVRIATSQQGRARLLQTRIDLARELHERVVQRLFGVSLVLGSDAALSDEARRRCGEEMHGALADLREALSRPLAPPTLDTGATLREELARLGPPLQGPAARARVGGRRGGARGHGAARAVGARGGAPERAQARAAELGARAGRPDGRRVPARGAKRRRADRHPRHRHGPAARRGRGASARRARGVRSRGQRVARAPRRAGGGGFGVVSPDRNLRVLVVDDHDVVHWGFRLLLTEQPWVERCLTASSVEEALEMARRYEPHVALVDLFLGEESGAELCEAIRRESPATRILLISGAGWISPQAAKAAGAAGFVSKDWPAHDVAMAVRMVGKGMTVFAPRAEQPSAPLSDREREVLGHMAKGATNKEIAEELFLSPHTVKEHTSALYRKLGVRNRAEAVQRAERLGLTA